jgi:hypothetical protein
MSTVKPKTKKKMIPKETPESILKDIAWKLAWSQTPWDRQTVIKETKRSHDHVAISTIYKWMPKIKPFYDEYAGIVAEQRTNSQRFIQEALANPPVCEHLPYEKFILRIYHGDECLPDDLASILTYDEWETLMSHKEDFEAAWPDLPGLDSTQAEIDDILKWLNKDRPGSNSAPWSNLPLHLLKTMQHQDP